jgi:DNA-binding IscR family transcriptional regulator
MTDVADRLRLPELLLSPVVNRLVAAGLVSRSEKDKIFPQRDPNSIHLTQIMDAMRDPQSIDVFPEGRWSTLVKEVGGRVDTALDQAFADQSLYDLLDAEQAEAKK